VGGIRFAPDPAVACIVASWPQAMRFERAEALGLTAETTIELIIQEHLEALLKA
jgi:hypothetical protein